MKEHVEKILNSSIRGFYPTVLSKKLNMKLEDVINELDCFVKEGKLLIKTQLLCEGCSRSIKEIDGIHNQTFFEADEDECTYCGEEFEDSPLVNGGIKYYVVRED